MNKMQKGLSIELVPHNNYGTCKSQSLECFFGAHIYANFISPFTPFVQLTCLL
jgi:hypothetical protein